MVARGAIYLVATKASARVVARLVRPSADLAGRTLVDVCEHT